MVKLNVLKNDAAYWTKIFQESPMGLALVAEDGTFLEVNNSLCSITGYTEVELLNKKFQNITHPDDLEVDVKMTNKLISKEIAYYEMNKRYLHKMGPAIWVKLTVHPVFNKDGSFNHFVSYITPLLNGEKLKAEYKSTNQITVRPTISIGEFWRDNWKTLTSFIFTGLTFLIGALWYLDDVNDKQNTQLATFTTQIQNINKNIEKIPTLEDIREILKE